MTVIFILGRKLVHQFGHTVDRFMADMMPKTRAIKDAIRKLNRNIHLEVDGGIDGKTAFVVAEAGANMIVAGTSVFRAPEGAAEAIKKLKSAQDKLRQRI